MTTGLTTNVAPDWMRNDASAPTLGLEVNTPQKGLLVQDKRPKDMVLPAGTTSGDIVLTPSNTNIGKTFTGVILKRDLYWIRVGNKQKFGDAQEIDGKMLWKAPITCSDITRDENTTGNLTPQQAQETVWYKVKDEVGNEKNKRKAEIRADFTMLEVVDGVVDPRKLGLVELSCKGMSYGAAKTLIAALAAAEKKGYKIPGIVVTFNTKSVGENASQAYAPLISGYIQDKQTYKDLVEISRGLNTKDPLASTTAAAEEPDSLPF